MKLFHVLISVLFFTAVIGTLASQVANTGENQTLGNLTGASLVLWGLVTLVVVAGFVVWIAKTSGVLKGR